MLKTIVRRVRRRAQCSRNYTDVGNACRARDCVFTTSKMSRGPAPPSEDRSTGVTLFCESHNQLFVLKLIPIFSFLNFTLCSLQFFWCLRHGTACMCFFESLLHHVVLPDLFHFVPPFFACSCSCACHTHSHLKVVCLLPDP